LGQLHKALGSNDEVGSGDSRLRWGPTLHPSDL
jgi:hypothetical protein